MTSFHVTSRDLPVDLKVLQSEALLSEQLTEVVVELRFQSLQLQPQALLRLFVKQPASLHVWRQ